MLKKANKQRLPSELGTEPIGKLLWAYSLPTIIGTLVNALYNIVDRIFIGQGVGPMAISGLTLTFPMMMILGAFGMLIGQGSATQISIYLGRKDMKTAENTLGNALVLTFIIMSIVISLSLFFLDDILIAFGGSEATIPYAKDYLKIIIPGHILTALSYGFNNSMRASGYPIKAMFTMLIGAVLNTILDPIFIFVFDWGIQGAAYSTLISMSVSAIWVMHHFTSPKSTLRFRRGCFKLNKKIILAILAIGMAPFFIQVSASLVNALINNALKTTGGDYAIGAFGIINSFSILIIMSIVGLSNGMQPIIGYNYGARQNDRVLRTLRYGIIIATLVTTIGGVTAELFPRQIARLFTTDQQLIDLTVHGMRICFLLFAVVGGQMVTISFFQAIGKAKISIFLSLTRQLIFLVPFILIFPPIWGLTGTWMVFPCADLISMFVASTMLYFQLKKLKQTSLPIPNI